MALTTHNYPLCCGIFIAGGARDGNGVYASSYTDAQKEAFRLELQRQKSKAVSVGMLLIALNSQQTPACHPLLLEEGFKDLTGPFYHPGHRRHITLYGYEVHPSKHGVPLPGGKPLKKKKAVSSSISSGLIKKKKTLKSIFNKDW